MTTTIQSQPLYVKPPVNKGSFYLDGFSFDRTIFGIIDPKFRRDGYIGEEAYQERAFLAKLPPVLEALYFFDLVIGIYHEGGFRDVFSDGYLFPLYRCLNWFYESNELELLAVFCMVIEYHELTYANTSEGIAFRQLATEAEKINFIKNLPEHYVKFDLPNKVSYNCITATSIEDLDKIFDSQTDTIPSKLFNHIRANPSRYVVDENGQPIADDFTGIYENTAIEKGYRFEMENGKPHGKFELFDEQGRVKKHGEFEHGRLKSESSFYEHTDKNGVYSITYRDTKIERDDKGRTIVTSIESHENSKNPKKLTRKFGGAPSKPIGKQMEWYESGAVKVIDEYFEENAEIEHIFEKYYENGQLEYRGITRKDEYYSMESYFENGQKKRESAYFSSSPYRPEKARWWYDDGTLAGYTAYDDVGNYIEHRGFYRDGSKSIEYTYNKNGDIVPFKAWDKQGNQIFKDGLGRIDYRDMEDYKYISGHNYMIEYLPDNKKIKTKFYDTGEIWSVEADEMKTVWFNKDGSPN